MQEHQRRILARIVDEIDRYRLGAVGSTTLLNNLWGLITAAEVDRTVPGARVAELYHAVSAADDSRQAWMPAEHRTSDAEFETALDDMRSWLLANASQDAGR